MTGRRSRDDVRGVDKEAVDGRNEHRSPDGAQRNPGPASRESRISRSYIRATAAPRIGFSAHFRASSTGRMNDFCPQVICPSGGFLTGLSSLISDFPKNISVPTHPKSILELSTSRSTDGRIAIVTDAGWDAVDAAASGAQRDAGRVGERPVSDQTAS